MSDLIKEHGFTAVKRDPKSLFGGNKNNKEPQPVLVSDVSLPETPLVEKVMKYVKGELSEETFNHRSEGPNS